MTDHALKVALSRAFFEVRGTHVDLTEGSITSPDGLVHYVVVDPATSNFKRQVHRPSTPDDGRRIVGYSHQFDAGSDQIVHSNASVVDGRKYRDIGVTDIFALENRAEHRDAHPRLLGTSTWNAEGTVETEQLVKPEKPAVERTVAQRITEQNAVLPTLAAFGKLDRGF